MRVIFSVVGYILGAAATTMIAGLFQDTLGIEAQVPIVLMVMLVTIGEFK